MTTATKIKKERASLVQRYCVGLKKSIAEVKRANPSDKIIIGIAPGHKPGSGKSNVHVSLALLIYLFYSCNMGTSDLPVRLRVAGIHIRQITSAHVTSVMQHSSSDEADSLNANTRVISEFFIYACLNNLIMVMVKCG